MSRGSKPGERRGGRKRGTPNKTTAAVKEALSDAFDDMGGTKALTAWAEDHPGDFYKLWAKLLPTDVAVSGSLTLEAIVGASRRE